MSSFMKYEDFAELFSQGGMSITVGQYEKFKKYSDILVEWNGRINLTAITLPKVIAEKHFYDSVYPFALCDASFDSFIDVGTGAGFPSIPLMIWKGGFKLTMLDSLNKRINFLNEVTSLLELDAVSVHGRAEEFGRKNEYREQFDAASARAVANLRDLSEYCLPFVKVGGVFYALKGKDGEQELKEAENAIKTLGGEVSEVKNYSLPSGDSRTLIVVQKVRKTDQQFPRTAGQIKKHRL